MNQNENNVSKSSTSKKVVIIIIIVAVLIVVALLVKGITAYLTATASKINTFTVGSVSINLLEPQWDNLADENNNGIKDVAENLTAKQTVTKDPQVENTGRNEAYVYLKVKVPKAKISQYDSTTSELFTYSVNEGWTALADTTVDEQDYIERVYYYSANDATLAPNTTTEALFNSVTFANIKSLPQELQLDQELVEITAYAIQTNNIDGITNEMTTAQKVKKAYETYFDQELTTGLQEIQFAVMESRNNNKINTVSLANNLSKINGLTDTNNQRITENTEIILPIRIKLNGTVYIIKEDGNVEEYHSLLPIQYQEVEYLESTGTQWIDTGILGITYTDEFSFIATYENELNNYWMFGWDEGGDYFDVNFYHRDYNGVFELAWGNSTVGNNVRTSDILEIGTAHNVSVKLKENKLVLTIDNIEIGNINRMYSNKSQSHGLFARLRNRTPRLYGESKVYEFKYWRDGVLIRNYIPCYCTSVVTDIDGRQCEIGTRGLYDLVTGEFYTNKNVTGSDFKIPGEE